MKLPPSLISPWCTVYPPAVSISVPDKEVKSELMILKVAGPLTLMMARAPPWPVAGAAMVVSGCAFMAFINSDAKIVIECEV
jgi:hypothetical protein